MENESFYKWRLAKIPGLGDAETTFLNIRDRYLKTILENTQTFDARIT